MPGSVDLNIAMDRSPVIRATLHEAERTLLIAVGWSSCWFSVPRSPAHRTDPGAGGAGVAGGHLRRHVPVRFSLNVLSLMALILAAGLVVDDAIVVLENIARHIDGMPPLKAAYVGTREVGFTLCR